MPVWPKSIHTFGVNEGTVAVSELTLVNGQLYGTTSTGGATGAGTVFRVDEDGSDYEILHSFAGGTADGANPIGQMEFDGFSLYGMTTGGGLNNRGVIFAVAVPEPSACLSMAAGLASLAGVRRARKRD